MQINERIEHLLLIMSRVLLFSRSRRKTYSQEGALARGNKYLAYRTTAVGAAINGAAGINSLDIKAFIEFADKRCV